MVEKDKTQAEFRVKANSDKSELAGLLHQIKTKMMEKGLVSAEELDEFKAKNLALQSELEKTRREYARKAQEDAARIHASTQRQGTNSTLSQRKDQGVQCVAERHIVSPEKTMRDLKPGKAAQGMAAIFEDYASGYTEPLVPNCLSV